MLTANDNRACVLLDSGWRAGGVWGRCKWSFLCFCSVVVSVLLPMCLLLRNFSTNFVGDLQRSVSQSRFEANKILPSLRLFLFLKNFSWFQNDGVGTERNTNGPSKIGWVWSVRFFYFPIRNLIVIFTLWIIAFGRFVFPWFTVTIIVRWRKMFVFI